MIRTLDKPRSRDVLITGALGIAGVGEALANPAVATGSIVPACFAAGMTLPLVVRSVAPTAALCVTLTIFLVQEIVVGTLSDGVTAFVVLMVAMYGAASRASPRSLPLVALASYGAIGVSVLLDEGGGDASSMIYALMVVTAALGAGRIVAARQQTIGRLHRDTQRLASDALEREDAAARRERARIAHELHDIVTHRVSAMVLQAATERRVVSREMLGPDRRDAADLARTLQSIEVLGREAMQELRTLLGALHHDDVAPRAPQPGTARLADLVEQSDGAGIDATLHVEGVVRHLPPGIDVSIFRIAQESLANAMRHAAGSTARVELEYLEGSVEIRVKNGPGRASDHVGSRGAGLGIGGMRERVELFGGTFTAAVDGRGGFEVIARFPATTLDASQKAVPR